jgi:hypothetical protein
VKDARSLTTALADPISVLGFSAEDWASLLSIARAERLDGSLAYRLADLPLPDAIAYALEDARARAAFDRSQALWEIEMARRALAPLGIEPILLKGSAFAFASLPAGVGRMIGDLDILVPRDRLDDVEAALLGAGFEWVKDDPYTQAYYRRWMHELPPLIHRERDRMIDVHHAILPLTARRRPDAAAMLADAVMLEDGLAMLCPEDMICHAAAHMLADGALEGGLRNLWDMHCLLSEFGERPGWWEALAMRARRHGLGDVVARAARLAHRLYGTGVPDGWRGLTLTDRLCIARLLSRDGWGQERRWLLGQAFYVRSHLLRMPPAMLARHLWTKWRKGYRPAG